MATRRAISALPRRRSRRCVVAAALDIPAAWTEDLRLRPRRSGRLVGHTACSGTSDADRPPRRRRAPAPRKAAPLPQPHPTARQKRTPARTRGARERGGSRNDTSKKARPRAPTREAGPIPKLNNNRLSQRPSIGKPIQRLIEGDIDAIEEEAAELIAAIKEEVAARVAAENERLEEMVARRSGCLRRRCPKSSLPKGRKAPFSFPPIGIGPTRLAH